ncbi:MAG: hypothetical protein U5L98_00965 [Halomonas sp.]|uniref:hypothetical protein n=1 Tax=Halomonas sp. TaxID=1486246 RepID=UPI002ACE2CCE|nr:hypothetical protein [Halomonas sp.]MDZ7851241.1 hypothetical protein [Halomonas sp.]
MQQQYTIATGAFAGCHHGEFAFLQMEFVDLAGPLRSLAVDRALGVVLAVSEAVVDLEEGVKRQAMLEGGPAGGDGAGLLVERLAAGFGSSNGLLKWFGQQGGVVAGQRLLILERLPVVIGYLTKRCQRAWPVFAVA